MKRRERDFVSLFNALWYRDFPVIPNHEELGRRAVWTTHIAATVKQCADLMGLFTCFESGGKTDAVIRTAQPNSKQWAKVEWEWAQPHKESVNEIDKLAKSENDADLSVFISYSRLDDRIDENDDYHVMNLQKITDTWAKIERPLLVFLVTYSFIDGRRHFQDLQTHYFKNGRSRMLRKQPALPWNVPDTKWAALLG